MATVYLVTFRDQLWSRAGQAWCSSLFGPLLLFTREVEVEGEVEACAAEDGKSEDTKTVHEFWISLGATKWGWLGQKAKQLIDDKEDKYYVLDDAGEVELLFEHAVLNENVEWKGIPVEFTHSELASSKYIFEHGHGFAMHQTDDPEWIVPFAVRNGVFIECAYLKRLCTTLGCLPNRPDTKRRLHTADYAMALVQHLFPHESLQTQLALAYGIGVKSEITQMEAPQMEAVLESVDKDFQADLVKSLHKTSYFVSDKQ